jgi:hypothetical protein
MFFIFHFFLIIYLKFSFFKKFKERSILDKYNEELNGEKKKSFKLGAHGAYDASDDKFIERLNQEHKAKAIRIDALNELKLATDFMTQQEMVNYFKFYVIVYSTYYLRKLESIKKKKAF